VNRIVVISLSLLIAFAWGIFFLSPKNKTLNSLKEEIRQKQFELQSQEEYLANLTGTAENLKNYQIQLSKIDSALPDTPELPALFDFLQKSASQSGLVLKGLEATSGTQEKKERGPRETRLNLFLIGSYTSFKNFLSILEHSSRLIEVGSLTFSSSEVDLINAKIGIKVSSY